MRHQERGLSIWPFVICLVLTLIFGFLWYSEKTNGEELAKARTKAVAERQEMVETVAKWETWAETISDAIGWRTKVFLGKTITDEEALKKELDPENPAGAVGKLRAESVVTAVKSIFNAKSGGVDAKDVGVIALKPEFKAKIAEAQAAYPGDAPTKPDDPDDATAEADYASKMAAWQKQYADYTAKIDALSKSDEWPVYKSVISGVGLFDPDTTQVVKFDFFVKPTVASVETFLPLPATISKGLIAMMKDRVDSLTQEVRNAKAETAKARTEVTNGDAAAPGLTEKLAAKEQELADQVAKLQKEAADARSALEQERVARTTAENALEKEKGDNKAVVADLTQKLEAEVQARLVAKQKVDIVVDRDDPDGEILSVDNNLGVAYVSLGFADKVVAGQKFRVSYYGRGMIRATKGEVVITKVIDRHYSQARIVGLVDGERPISARDMVSNPFFDKAKRLKVFVAGALRKYPKQIAAQRLASMGCDLQDAMDATTDFLVIPDSVKAPALGAPAEGEAAPAGQSDYDKLVAQAKNFGATLVTERMLEAFLDY